MYIGRERPADCSATRPKSRDEDVQRRIEQEAAGRAERDAAVREKERADRALLERVEKAEAQDEAMKRALKKREAEGVKRGAQQAIQRCDAFKANPNAMDAQQSAICDRYWNDRAVRTLKHGTDK
jgi:hypothetical protein